MDLIDKIQRITEELSPSLAKGVINNEYLVGKVIDYGDLGVPEVSYVIDCTQKIDYTMTNEEYGKKILDLYLNLMNKEYYRC